MTQFVGEQTEEITQAALSADDAAQRTDREQTAARYVFDAYDLDPRSFVREVGDSDEDAEYALRDELASREKNHRMLTRL